MKSENSQLVMVGLKNIFTAIRNKEDVFKKKKKGFNRPEK